MSRNPRAREFTRRQWLHLAAAGMQFIQEQFPMQKSVARMIAIYRELLAQKELVVE